MYAASMKNTRRIGQEDEFRTSFVADKPLLLIVSINHRLVRVAVTGHRNATIKDDAQLSVKLWQIIGKVSGSSGAAQCVESMFTSGSWAVRAKGGLTASAQCAAIRKAWDE